MNVKGGKWSKYKKIRQSVIKTLAAEYNQAFHEAIFSEDKERVKRLKEALDFVNAFSSNMYFFTCPMCGSRLFTHATVLDVNFDNDKYGDYPQYKFKKHYDELHISKCDKCGWYNIEEF